MNLQCGRARGDWRAKWKVVLFTFERLLPLYQYGRTDQEKVSVNVCWQATSIVDIPDWLWMGRDFHDKRFKLTSYFEHHHGERLHQNGDRIRYALCFTTITFVPILQLQSNMFLEMWMCYPGWQVLSDISSIKHVWDMIRRQLMAHPQPATVIADLTVKVSVRGAWSHRIVDGMHERVHVCIKFGGDYSGYWGRHSTWASARIL